MCVLGTGVPDSHEPSWGCGKWNRGPLEEQSALSPLALLFFPYVGSDGIIKCSVLMTSSKPSYFLRLSPDLIPPHIGV